MKNKDRVYFDGFSLEISSITKVMSNDLIGTANSNKNILKIKPICLHTS